MSSLMTGLGFLTALEKLVLGWGGGVVLVMAKNPRLILHHF